MRRIEPVDCDDLAESLSAYLDGELSDAAALERHLAVCGACRGRLEALGQVSQLLHVARGERMPAPLAQRIGRAAAQRRARPAAARRVLARAAAALVGFALVTAFTRSDPPRAANDAVVADLAHRIARAVGPRAHATRHERRSAFTWSPELELVRRATETRR